MANPRCNLGPSLDPSFPKLATIRHGSRLSHGRTDHNQSSNGYSQYRCRIVAERCAQLQRSCLVAPVRDRWQPFWMGGTRFECRGPWVSDTPNGIRATRCNGYGCPLLVLCAACTRSGSKRSSLARYRFLNPYHWGCICKFFHNSELHCPTWLAGG